MLVLSRRLKEKILIPQIHTAIEVLSIKPGTVRLGIDAPPEITVLREEIQNRADEWKAPSPPPVAATPDARVRLIHELLPKRLAIACAGLAEARRRLQTGCTDDVELILDHLEEDLRLLQRRLDDSESQAVPASQRKARKALLVEDDQNERELLASLLRMAGVEVDTADDGIDALNHLRDQDRPDVVLMDMGLPRCDGPTAVRNIRRDPAYAGLKIYAVSGSAPEQFNLDQGPRGIDRWFQKPIDYEALLRNLTQETDSPRTCP